MVSAARFRNGTFQRNHTPQLSRSPLPQAGSGSAGSLLDEYDRAEWAQNQADTLEWGLQQEQITPGWLEPIGGTGLYVSPNEPVDPTDCDRYPDSPYCGGSGVDPFSLGSLSPVGADITFTANRNGTEYCIRLDTSLFAVSLPPLDVCYRTPNARPFQPPTPPVNRGTQTPQDLQPQFFPFDFEYEPGACYYELTYKGKVGSTSGPQDFVGTMIMGRPSVGGFWVWTINDRRRWRLVVPGIGFDGSTFNGGTDTFTYQPTFPIPPSAIAIRPLSILPNVCPAVEPPPNYRNLPQPEPRGENPMPCCNTAEIEEMLRVIMLRLGTAQYPATVPESLTDTETATTQIENITDFLGWTVQQIDALTGQFPIEVEIKDADPSESGNQTRKVKLPNLAESIAEIYALSLRSGVSGDIHTSFLMRLAAEMIATKNAALITQDYAKANASYLGYKGNTVKRKIDYAFNVTNLDNLEKILQESSKTIIGWQDEDKNTVQSYLEKLMFAASIIKLTHFRSNKLVDGLVDELGNLLGLEGEEGTEQQNQESEDEWRAFLQEINNANGGFNRNSPIKPEVVDPTVSGETSVDTRFTGFDLIPNPSENSTNSEGA